MLYMDCTQAEAEDTVEYRKDVARAFNGLRGSWSVGFGSNQDEGSVLEMVSWMDPGSLGVSPSRWLAVGIHAPRRE